MNKKPKPIMYVVRKYVKATSVADAIRKERKMPIHEVFVDEEWRKNNNLPSAIGFVIPSQEQHED